MSKCPVVKGETLGYFSTGEIFERKWKGRDITIASGFFLKDEE